MRVVNVIWWLPIKIIKCGISLLNLESTSAAENAKTTPRRRPLHTCGASLLAIAHKTCIKLQDLDAPLGSIAKRAITFFNSFSPFFYAMLYRWLAILSFIDDHMLVLETKIESIFPPSKHAFDKLDWLVCSAEALPEHIDDFLKKFPLIMQQFPFLDRILVRLISWLNFLLSILTHWGSKNTKEKEIPIDVNCSNINTSESEEKAEKKVEKSLCSCQEKANAAKSYNEVVTSEIIEKSVKRLCSLKHRAKALDELRCAAESPMYLSYESANSSPVSDCSSQDEMNMCSQTSKSDTTNCTYKEMLEKGKKEEDETKRDDEHELLKAIVNEEKA